MSDFSSPPLPPPPSSLCAPTSNFAPIPPGQAAFHLPPATQKTVVTTTTTTTLTFPPILLPRPSSPPLHSHPAAHSPLHLARLDPRQFPLANAAVPSDWASRGLSLTLTDSAQPIRFNPGRSMPKTDHTCLRPPPAGPSPSPSHSRSKKRHPSQPSPPKPSSALSSPPSKKPRLFPHSPPSVGADAQPHSGLPLPLPSTVDRLASSSSSSSSSSPPSCLNQAVPVSNSTASWPPAHPLQSPRSQSELSTLLSLPSLVHEYSNLPSHLQQYTIFNLLRHSSVPVLQFAQSLIGPALKRDLISDLPPEVSHLILSKIDGPSLCRSTQVNRLWCALINRGRSIWKNRLLEEGLWVGDGTEETEAEECVLSENGSNRSDLSRFTRLWNAGTWWPTVSREDEPMLGVTDEGSSSHGLCDRLESSPKLTSIQAPITPASRAGSLELTPVRADLIEHRYRTLGVDPYKLLYRKRFLTRKNWMKKEPKRMSFRGHALTVVTCLQFDWDKMVAASDDNLVHSYELTTGNRLRSFVGHQGGVWALQFVGDTLVTGSTDRTVRVWNMATGRNTHIFYGHTSTVRCLQIVEPIDVSLGDPDGQEETWLQAGKQPRWEPAYPMVVTGSRDYTLRVWRLPTPLDEEYTECPLPGSPEDAGSMQDNSASNPFHLHQLIGHGHAVRALAAFGRIMVSGSYDCTVRAWDIMTGKCLQEMRGHTQKVYSVVLDHSRGRCASGSMDNTVRLWDLKTGATLKVLGEHSSLVGLLGLSPNQLVSAAADATLRVWNPLTGQSERELRGHLGAITCFSHDQFRVVSGADGTLKLWNPNEGELVRDLLTGFSAVWQVGINDRFCVVAVQRGQESEYVVLDFGRTDGKCDHDLEFSPFLGEGEHQGRVLDRSLGFRGEQEQH